MESARDNAAEVYKRPIENATAHRPQTEENSAPVKRFNIDLATRMIVPIPPLIFERSSAVVMIIINSI